MYYPVFRPRRLRQNETLRRLVRETHLHLEDLIQPLFVVHGRGVRQEISSMPGCFRLSVDELAKEAKEVAAMRIPGIILLACRPQKMPSAQRPTPRMGSSSRRSGPSRTPCRTCW